MAYVDYEELVVLVYLGEVSVEEAEEIAQELMSDVLTQTN